MHPVKTEDCNIVYKAPASMPECGDLWVHRVRPGVIRATYEPNEQELELLKAGGRVQLTLAHEPIPPIMMEVMDKEITESVAEHPWRIDKEPSVAPPHEGGSSNGATSASADQAESTTQAPDDGPSSG